MANIPTQVSESFKRLNPHLFKPYLDTLEVTNKAVKQVVEKVVSKHKSKSYNQEVVVQFFAAHHIPKPEFEFQFHAIRKWRFDLAWWKIIDKSFSMERTVKLAVEVDGGIWIRGGHNRGEQMKKDWEKSNEAQLDGWKILRCEPSELCTATFVALIQRGLAR